MRNMRITKKLVPIQLVSAMILSTLLISSGLIDSAGYGEVNLSKNDFSKIELEFDFLKLEIKKVGEYDSISIEGLDNFDEFGMPILPFITAKVLLPQGREVKDVRVSGNELILDGTFNVEWASRPIPMCSETSLKTKIDDPNDISNEEVYDSSQKFPGEVCSQVSTQILRGYNILILNLFPVQYIPKTGTISYFKSMKLIISTVPITLPLPCTFRSLQQDEERLKSIVDNPWMMGTYRTFGEGEIKSSSLVDPAESYDYVLITNNDLKSSFQDLIDWKNERGIAATVVTVEDIYDDPSYDGVDDAEEVRNFIKDAYMNWDIDYVLLGGDDECVPYRGVYVSAEGRTDYNCPCDMYFGALDGNWDDDGDGIYGEAGEEDLYAEVFVGRATVDIPEEVLNFVRKTITYEQVIGAPYIKRGLMVGERLDSYTWGGNYKDEIVSILPKQWGITKLYEKTGTFSKAAVIEELNAGKNLVNHMGHATQSHVMGLYRSDVDGLTNKDYFFAYSQGCNAGAFDQSYSGNSEAIAEHFILAEHAAFAVVMNSRYGWYKMLTTDGPSQYYDREFFDAVFNEDIMNLGRANQDSKEDNVGRVGSTGAMRWCYFELNLLGDPETSICENGPERHDIAVSNLQASSPSEKNQIAYITAMIFNYGKNDESNVAIEFLIDDVMEDDTILSFIESGAAVEVSFSWTPAICREYAVGIRAVPVYQETCTSNNLREKQVHVIDSRAPKSPTNVNAELAGANNKDIMIMWELSEDDANGENDVTGYDIYYSSTYDVNKDGYIELASVDAGMSSYVHENAGDGNQNNYFYYVIVKDNSGNENGSTDQAGKFVRKLQTGKQLISVPLVQSDAALTTVLQTIDGNYNHVQWYNPLSATDHWRTYSTSKPSDFNDLLNIDHKIALWINMITSDNLTVAGRVPQQTSIQLYKGWNFIGYASFIDRTVSEALDGIPCEKVEGFDENNAPYYLKTLSGSDWMEAGCGYWLCVTENCTWTVEN